MNQPNTTSQTGQANPLSDTEISNIYNHWAANKAKIGSARVVTDGIRQLSRQILSSSNEQEMIDRLVRVRGGVEALRVRGGVEALNSNKLITTEFYADLLNTVFAGGLHHDLKPLTIAHITGLGENVLGRRDNNKTRAAREQTPLKRFDGQGDLVHGNDEMFQNRVKKAYAEWKDLSSRVEGDIGHESFHALDADLSSRVEGDIGHESFHALDADLSSRVEGDIQVIPASVSTVAAWFGSSQDEQQIKDRARIIREGMREEDPSMNEKNETEFLKNIISEAQNSGLGLHGKRVMIACRELSTPPNDFPNLSELRNRRYRKPKTTEGPSASKNTLG